MCLFVFLQGPGDFRDVIQNRRNDVMFSPRIAGTLFCFVSFIDIDRDIKQRHGLTPISLFSNQSAFNVKTFLSLIQADGYNPLSVEAIVFVIRDFEACKRIATQAVGEADGHRAQREALTGILHGGPFRPGQLFLLVEEQHIDLLISRQDFIDSVGIIMHMTCFHFACRSSCLALLLLSTITYFASLCSNKNKNRLPLPPSIFRTCKP